MARIRSIHPDACTSEKLAQVSGDAERCYWRLQTHCDDEGRCEDHTRLIWAALFPLHEEIGPTDVDVWLDELENVGLLVRYESCGRRYVAVTQWERFQHPQRPKPSTIPAPSDTPPVHVRDASANGHGDVSAGEGGGGGDARGAPKPKAQRIPDTFTVEPPMMEWVRERCPHVDWEFQTERFVNHFKASSQPNAKKLDWEKAWRNWMMETEKPRPR